MASSGKKKTTMAKLNREHKLRERRMEKKARKDARKNAPADQPDTLTDTLTDAVTATTGEASDPTPAAPQQAEVA